MSNLVNSIFNLNPTGVSAVDVANGLDTVATAFDTAALAIDSMIAAGDVASAAIGATAGAGIAVPEGDAPVVVTGPTGALVGMGLYELSPQVRGGRIAGNALATFSTGLTAISDVITSENNDLGSLSLSESGFQYSHETMVGRDTLTSDALSAAGWISPIGLTSAPLQAAAWSNDRGKLYIGPLAKIPKSIPIRKDKIKLNWE